jgi:exosome complex component RRP43
MVTLGEHGGTRILAGCTLLVGRPSASTPNHGDFELYMSASPLSGPRFDLGGRESIESTSVMIGAAPSSFNNVDEVESTVQVAHDPNENTDVEHPPQPLDVKVVESYICRTLRQSGYINPEELCIVKGKAAWRIRITVHILNCEGNVLDGSMLCILAALRDLELPMVEVEEVEGTGSVVRVVTDGAELTRQQQSKKKRQSGKKLTLGAAPISTTLAILPQGSGSEKKNVLVVDPTSFEEDMSYGNSVTVVCNSNGEVVNFSKKGSETKLSVNEMKAVVELGMERARKLDPLVIGS